MGGRPDLPAAAPVRDGGAGTTFPGGTAPAEPRSHPTGSASRQPAGTGTGSRGGRWHCPGERRARPGWDAGSGWVQGGDIGWEEGC